MMPITPLPTLPVQLPVPPAAPVTLDFTTLLQSGAVPAPMTAPVPAQVSAPVPVLIENIAHQVQTSLPEPDAAQPDKAALPTEFDRAALPAPPSILAMLQPAPPVPAPVPTPTPAPDVPPSAPAGSPPISAPTTLPVPATPAIQSLPIQPDAPRPARAASVLPVLPVPLPTVESAPPADPTPQEASSSTPPVESALFDVLPAAPDPQPAPAAAPQARGTGADTQPQAPLDTTDPHWIARMADEIARTAGDDGRARFRLNPETLGSMEVTVRHTADGISVRFEVESEQTRALIAHVEHRLQAEARANGLRIADTQVDLASQQQQQRDGRERPTEQPLVAIRAGVATDSTQSADAPIASTRYA